MLIAKVHRQHNSLVITIPKLATKHMEVKKGDYIAFHDIVEHEGQNAYIITKLESLNGHTKKAKNKPN